MMPKGKSLEEEILVFPKVRHLGVDSAAERLGKA